MKKRINIFSVTVLLGISSPSYAQNSNGVIYKNANARSEVFCNDTIQNSTYTGWGYNIYVDGKLFIHQPHIPALSGNKGFVSKTDADKTAQLVISKTQRNIIPPDIGLHELDSLKIKLP